MTIQLFNLKVNHHYFIITSLRSQKICGPASSHPDLHASPFFLAASQTDAQRAGSPADRTAVTALIEGRLAHKDLSGRGYA